MRELFENAPEDPIERQKFTEKVISRLARRSRKTITAVVTPYPISNASFNVDINGTILRYMFPCNGKITKGFLRLSAKPRKEVHLRVKVFNDTSVTEKTYNISKKLTDSVFDLSVLPGDCLEVSLLNEDKENPITEAWISFLWEPSVSDVITRSFLIDEIENMNKEVANDASSI